MLRASLRRALKPRQFSSTSSAWNTARRDSPPTTSDPPTPADVPPTHPPVSSDESTATPGASSSSHTNGTSESSSAYDLNQVRQRLRELSDQAAIAFRTKADDFTGTTKTTLSQLGAQLNKVTGYEEIEALKRQVVGQESRIESTRQAAREAKVSYETAVAQRSNSQREVNDLLQRKSVWTDSDVSRFTTLVRQDHMYEQEEARAKAAVDDTEDAVEREFDELMRSILARYHEEQVWSDKIRSASTYGQLAALGLNLLVFIMAILVVEPWKRRRLAQTFEKKVEELSVETKTMVDKSMEEIARQLEEQAKLLAAVAEYASKLDRERAEESVVEPTVVAVPELSVYERTRTLAKDRDIRRSVATIVLAAGVASIVSSFWGVG